MKNKRVLIGIIIGLIVLGIGSVVGIMFSSIRGEAFELADGTEMIWMDRYDEKTVEVTKGDPAKLKWKSSDKKIVTVEAGRLSAEGVGQATVTVSSGTIRKTINVRVNDSGSLPVIVCDDFDAYQDAEIPLPAKIKYNGEITDIQATYTAEVTDTSIAEFKNGKIRGIALGETNAVIKTTYKGLQLEKLARITVKENSLVDFSEKEVQIYVAKDNPKLNQTTLTPKVIRNGQVVEKAELSFEATEGADCVVIEGSKITAVKEGIAVVKATYQDKDITLSNTITVKVNPNWIASGFVNGSLHAITWQPATGTIGGRKAEGTDMMEYRAGDLSNSSYWEHRVSGADTGTLLMDLYRKGYRYFAYDVYYGSNQNFYMGTDRGPQTVFVGEFFRRNYVTVLRDENNDGKQEVTNRVDKNVWMTYVFDLLTLIESDPSTTSGFFFTVNDNKTSSYVMNVRYYLDDSILPSENLVYTDKGDYTEATEDEFDIAIPVSVGYQNLNKTGKYDTEIAAGEKAEYGPYAKKVGGRTGVYRYQANTDNGWKNNLVVASSMNKNYNSGMMNLSKHGRYLVFDMYIEDADAINISMNHTEDNAMINLGRTDLSQFSKWLNIYKNGKLQYTIKEGGWYTVSIGFLDNYKLSAWRSTIYFAACGKGDVVYIDNVRYQKNKDFLPTKYEGVAPPKGVEVIHPDVSLESVTSGKFKGTTKFTSKNSGLTWENHWASVRFTDVTHSNAEYGGKAVQSYYNNKYKYIKMDIYLAENTKGFGYFSWQTYGEKEGTNYSDELMVGDSNFQTLLFDAKTKKFATKIENNKWYTLFIPTDWPFAGIPQWSLIEFRSIGGSDKAPAVVYMKNLEYTKKAYEFDFSTLLVEPSVEIETTKMYDSLKVTVNRNVTTQLIVNGNESKAINIPLKASGIAFEGSLGSGNFVNQLKIGENTLTVRVSDGSKSAQTTISYEYKGYLYVRDEKGTFEYVKDGNDTVLKYTEKYEDDTNMNWLGMGSAYISTKNGEQDNDRGNFAVNGVKYMTMKVKLTKGTGLHIFYDVPSEEPDTFRISTTINVGDNSSYLDDNGSTGTLELNKWVTVKIPLSYISALSPYRQFTMQPCGLGSELLIKEVKYFTEDYEQPREKLTVAVEGSGTKASLRILYGEAKDVDIIVNGNEETKKTVTLSYEGSYWKKYAAWCYLRTLTEDLKIGNNTITVRTMRGDIVEEAQVNYMYDGYLYSNDSKGTVTLVSDEATGEQVLKFTTTGKTNGQNTWCGVGSNYIATKSSDTEYFKDGEYARYGVKYMTLKVKLVGGTGIRVCLGGPANESIEGANKTVTVGNTDSILDNNGVAGKLETGKWVTVKIPLTTAHTNASWRNFYIEPLGTNPELYIKDVTYWTNEYVAPFIPIEKFQLALNSSNEIEIILDALVDNNEAQIIINGNEQKKLTTSLDVFADDFYWKKQGYLCGDWFSILRFDFLEQLKLGDNTITVRVAKDGIAVEKSFTYKYNAFLFAQNTASTLEMVTVGNETVMKFTDNGTNWNGLCSSLIAKAGEQKGMMRDKLTYVTMKVKLIRGDNLHIYYQGSGNTGMGDSRINVGDTSKYLDDNGQWGKLELNQWVTVKMPIDTSNKGNWTNFFVEIAGGGEMYVKDICFENTTYQEPAEPVSAFSRATSVLFSWFKREYE